VNLDVTGDQEVQAEAADGWPIGGLLRHAGTDADIDADGTTSGAVLVPGSRHERDAYTTVADALAARGVSSLRIDVRGRGSSLGPQGYADMAPLQRRRVSEDVRAALDRLAAVETVDAGRLALVVEQDTAADALTAVGDDPRVRAVVVVSARHGARVVTALAAATRPVPVFGLVSTEDREGLRATVDAYLAGAPDTSRLEVFRGLGFGTTMFSTRQFEHPDAEPLEAMIAGWLAERLG
jgi:predicted alpha/beta hydrolase